MRVKNIVEEDFVNYRKPCMFIGTPSCNFKCDKEAGCKVCQNSLLAAAPVFDIDDDVILLRYCNNLITEAICFGGLEPFDTFEELLNFIIEFRKISSDDIIIYTGYYPEEIKDKLYTLIDEVNGNDVIIKFGRFIPNQKSHFDAILGIELSSPNQFATTLFAAVNDLVKEDKI